MIEQPFDMCELARGAGATFVARCTTWHAAALPGLIAEAMRHRGFSVIEVITGCHVNYGKRNRRETAVKMLRWQKEHAVPVEQYQGMSEDERRDRFAIGILHSVSRPEYTAEYGKIIRSQAG